MLGPGLLWSYSATSKTNVHVSIIHVFSYAKSNKLVYFLKHISLKYTVGDSKTVILSEN